MSEPGGRACLCKTRPVVQRKSPVHPQSSDPPVTGLFSALDCLRSARIFTAGLRCTERIEKIARRVENHIRKILPRGQRGPSQPDRVWQHFYPGLEGIPVPISAANFNNYGCSASLAIRSPPRRRRKNPGQLRSLRPSLQTQQLGTENCISEYYCATP
jgi:hypothetical protein